MPQTGNSRPVLQVNQLDATVAKLSAISKAVLAKPYGQTVWKGITGPEDGYTYYWLWVESRVSLQLVEGHTFRFKILDCAPFSCGDGSFSYGVNIVVIKED